MSIDNAQGFTKQIDEAATALAKLTKKITDLDGAIIKAGQSLQSGNTKWVDPFQFFWSVLSGVVGGVIVELWKNKKMVLQAIKIFFKDFGAAFLVVRAKVYSALAVFCSSFVGQLNKAVNVLSTTLGPHIKKISGTFKNVTQYLGHTLTDFAGKMRRALRRGMNAVSGAVSGASKSSSKIVGVPGGLLPGDPEGKQGKGGKKRKGGKKGGLGLGTKVGIGAVATVGILALSATPAYGKESKEAANGVNELGAAMQSSGQSGLDMLENMDLLMNGLFLIGPLMNVAGAAVSGLGKVLRVVGAIARANPIILIFTAIAAAAGLIMANWDKVKGFFQGVFDAISGIFSGLGEAITSIFSGIANFFSGIGEAIVAVFKSMVRKATALIPDFLLPDGLIEWMKEADDAAVEVAANVSQSAPAMLGASAAAAAVSPAVGGGKSVTNNSETNANITVNAHSDNPRGIALETAAEIERIVAMGNKGVYQ